MSGLSLVRATIPSSNVNTAKGLVLVTPKEEAQQKLCKQMERMTGQPIIGLRDILNMLTHPDVLPLTNEWLTEWYKESH